MERQAGARLVLDGEVVLLGGGLEPGVGLFVEVGKLGLRSLVHVEYERKASQVLVERGHAVLGIFNV